MQAMTNCYYIGVDIGSSSAKLVLIDQGGAVLGEECASYEVAMPRPDWKEIAPERWFDASLGALKRLLEPVDRRRVRAIGFTGQMHSTVFLDSDGAVIRPAIMWNDCRATREAEVLRRALERDGGPRYLRSVVANGSAAASLAWLRANEPENFARLDRFLIASDYLVYRYCGAHGTDLCEASTSGLFDPAENRWSPRMLELTDLRLSQCPRVRGSAETVGMLLPELARELGLDAGVRIIAGTGDNPAAAVSTGCFTGQRTVISIGTAGVAAIPLARADLEAGYKNVLFSLDGRETFVIVQGTVQSAGNTYSWLMDRIFALDGERFARFSVDLERDFQPRLLFYPHFIGEKSVRVDPDVRGACLGISSDTTREALALAVMEGVCFAFREIFEKMRLDLGGAVRLTGGGAKNAAWTQVMADVLNVEIELSENTSSAAKGVALIARMSEEPDLRMRDFERFVSGCARRVRPRREYAKLYDEKYELFKRLYPAIKSVYG